jgi:alkanesulfonate monooxygenase SsuD/methylene tetrahydromethanopterin reductase-like flavin-dependent oxidoreductase (luciferase family)
VKLGVTLPQFRDDPEPALAVARRAEAIGLDGVFVFDHLWPLHQPDRPALHSLTLLGALAAETERVTLASFVARVSLLPDAVLVHTLFGLHRMLDGRFIAGLGTGDSDNRDENVAYGVGFPPAAARAQQVVDCCRRLRELDVRTWVGGDSPTARGIAARESDGWNGWGLSADEFASLAVEVRAESERDVEVTWGGQVLVARTERQAHDKWERYGTRPGLVHGTVDDLRRHLSALADAGASWAVCSPLDVGDEALDLVAEARP